jgi:hypothetical protein
MFQHMLLPTQQVIAQVYSRIATARRLMVVIFIIWHIFTIHLPIFSTIQNGRCGQFELYFILYSVYLVITVCVFPSTVMAIFGYLAYRNMKQLHTRVRPTGPNINNDHENTNMNRRDRDLLVMVIAEVFCHFITMILYSFIIVELAATSYMNKTIQRIQIENYILFVAIFLILTNNAMAFYICIAEYRQREMNTTMVSRSQRAPAQADT